MIICTRPLAEIIRARMEAAGIGADDPGVQFARAWNAERQAAAAAEPEPQPEAEQATLADLMDEPEPEAAQ